MKNVKQKEDIIEFLKSLVAREIKESKDTIDVDAQFFDFGFDSISSLYLVQQIEEHFEININQLDFWDYPTISTFAEHLYKEHQAA